MPPWTAAAAWRTQAGLARLQLDLASLAFAAPLVIGARFAKAARDHAKPGFAFDPEWQRMVTEKVSAAMAAQRTLATYGLRHAGRPFDAAAALAAMHRSVGPTGRKVRANAKRLAR